MIYFSKITINKSLTFSECFTKLTEKIPVLTRISQVKGRSHSSDDN